MTDVLDSWAVLAYLHERAPAAALVAGLLDDGQPVMSWINLGEVFYVVRRREGETEAATVIRDLRDVIRCELPDEGRVVAAARIKAGHPLSYAVAFAAATAAAHEGVLWTGDPELMVPRAPWRWRDLR